MFADAEIGTPEELEKVDMPMGIDIGAEDPDEIAISILAKLIEVKNKSYKGIAGSLIIQVTCFQNKESHPGILFLFDSSRQVSLPFDQGCEANDRRWHSWN